MKKQRQLLCNLVLVFLLSPRVVWAGTYSGGVGDATAPYQIGNATDWLELINSPSDWDQSFVLVSDISLSDLAVTPVAPEPPLAPVRTAPSGGKVTAPMPGLILEIMVAVGDHVVSGTPVVKMEAMKMENEIPSPVNGTVKTITVKKGDNVSTDETLMVIEEQG